MSVEPKHIAFDEFIRDAQALFDEAARDGQPVVIERGGRLFTLRPPKARRKRQRRVLTADDPLWELVGSFTSDEPNNDVADNKHKYIAEALASHKAPETRQRPTSNADTSDINSKPTSMGTL